jgi:transposase InsO family protein
VAQPNPAQPPSRIRLPGQRELRGWGTKGTEEWAARSAGKHFGLLSVPEKLQCPAWDTLSGYTCPGAAASTRFATRQRLGVCWLCYASYGPQRIAHELNRRGIPVGKTAVHGVLKRHRLNNRRERLEWVRKAHGEIVTRAELESARDKAKTRHIQAKEPGELVGIDTFYVGCLKGVGRIYQLTACDTASSFAWAKLYTDKSVRSTVDFLNHITGNAQGVTIKAVLTDNGLEFTTNWESGNHRFEKALKEQGIKHRYTRVKHPWTNGFVERLNRTILEEFYQVALRKKRYLLLEELQQDLSSFIQHYNFFRPHQGYRLNGSLPADIFCGLKNAA